MTKQAAEQIAQQYYQLGSQLALEKVGIDLGDIQEAMEAQRELYHGSPEARIGSTMEQRRREGAILGTMLGGGMGGLGGLVLGKASGKGKALSALAALLGTGVGAGTGNLLGRLGGLTSGAAEGGMSAIPGAMGVADYISQPLKDY